MLDLSSLLKSLIGARGGNNSVSRDDLGVIEKNSSFSKKMREKGNEALKSRVHNDAIHRSALYYYSKSIAFAPANSEELALGFNNRSVLLLHLSKYECSIVDIDYSLEITKSPVTTAKLLSRKALCLWLSGEKVQARRTIRAAEVATEEISCNEQEIKDKILRDLNQITKKNARKLKKPITRKIESLMKQSDYISCLSNAVKVNYSEEYGLHIVARRNIKTGEPVIIENSFCGIPDVNNAYIICSYCLRITWNTIPCENCVFCVYCSKECKESAFKEFHNYECKVNTFENTVMSQQLKENLALASRMVIKAINEKGVKKLIEVMNELDSIDTVELKKKLANETLEMKPNSFEFCYSILSHFTEKQPFMLLNSCKSYAEKFFEKLKALDDFKDDLDFKNNIPKLENLMMRFFNILTINAHKNQGLVNINDNGIPLGDIGLTINLIASLVNHSCHPNVERFYSYGPRIFLYAERPIKKDEQVFCTYGPVVEMGFKERQIDLEKYFFTCKCKVCEENWPVLTQEYISSLTCKWDKSENKNIASFVRKIDSHMGTLFRNQNIDFQDINAMDNTCRIIDIGYSNLSPLEAAAVCSEFRQYLWSFFQTLYMPNFGIPDKCELLSQ